MSRRISLITSLVLLAVAAVLLWQRQPIYDWYKLRGYTPPAAIAKLADDTTMLPATRRVFYVQHPQLEDKAEFNSHCNAAEQTIVLGCYIKNGGIYLYDITDKRLEGVEEVTAAHELLHAEYDRLSPSERAHVDDMVNAAYKAVKNGRIRDTIENYRKNGADVTNELHSILGTEVRDLPDNLEQYYGRYFKDRKKVVSYSEEYEAVFIKQQQKIESLAKQIDTYEKNLTSERAAIEAEITALDAESARLDGLRRSGQTDEYNAAVPSYNARANALNDRIKAYNASLEEYRALIAEYNKLAQTQRELNNAIDSRISTPSTR